MNTEKKIDGFANLPTGWCYGEGGPISGSVIEMAKIANSALLEMGFVNTDAFPGIDGEISVVGYVKPHYSFEMEIESNGFVDWFFEAVTSEEVNEIASALRVSVGEALDAARKYLKDAAR